MAAEEDKKFDAVLGGFLVHDLRIRAGDLHCPEADTLAAYHELSLLPEEMNSWKAHIVGCARCQAILAELEATDSIPLQVPKSEEVLTPAAAKSNASNEPGSAGREAPAPLPEKSRVTPISRGVRWQWLALAGATAAASLVWVAWHENWPLQIKTSEIKTAKLEPPAAPPSPVARDDREAVSSEELSRISKDQGMAGGAIPAKPAPKAKSLKQLEKSDSRARLAHSELGVDKQANARAATALDSSMPSSNAQKPSTEDAKAAAVGAMAETVIVQAESAEVQNRQPQQNLQAQQSQVYEGKIPGPNPSKAAEPAKKRKSESSATATGYRNGAAAAAPQPAPPAAPVPSAFNDNAALRMASAVSPYVISAPGNKTLWRVGHIGMIEASTDGGASWSRQVSNVSVELTAGSAPSEKVCWIVGQTGTILLTIDGGSHWTTIHSPLTEDLGGVRATDALHATIWNLANTKVFETSDGGLAWKPAASQ